MIAIGCTTITIIFLCLICCRKPYKTAVVRLSEDLPTHYAGTVLAPEGIIHPDVSFYTQVQPCSGTAPTAVPSPTLSQQFGTLRPESGRLPTPCKPLQPAYQPTQLLAITTVRLPYLTTTDHLALPPGYVSLRDAK